MADGEMTDLSSLDGFVGKYVSITTKNDGGMSGWVVEPPGRVGEPVVDGDRGFLLYGGGPIQTDYGHEIKVKESSAASGPHVWLFIDSVNAQVQGGDPHLNLAQAIALRTVLDQFIESVPGRWSGGQEKLDAAKAIVRGEMP